MLIILATSCNISINTEDKKDDDTLAITEKVTVFYDTVPKVTGIGGIFFQSKNPQEINAWYGKNLGLVIDEFGSPFEFRNANRPEEANYLRWSPFEEGSEYFLPSDKPPTEGIMIALLIIESGIAYKRDVKKSGIIKKFRI